VAVQDLIDEKTLLKQLSLPAKVEILRLIGDDKVTLAEIISKAEDEGRQIPAYRETVHRYLKEMIAEGLLYKEENGGIVYSRALKGISINLVSLTVEKES
jgi:DNA-binding transcriptional ArsR family regulator